MKIADLEHLENVRKPNPTIQGGFISFESFARASAQASNRVVTWSFAYNVSIAP